MAWRQLLSVLICAGLCLGFGALDRCAADAIMDFQGLQNFEPVDNYYDGGYGGMGSGPGPNYGVTFSSNAVALWSEAAGGIGDFSNDPYGNTIALGLNGNVTMDLVNGWQGAVEFSYAAMPDAGANVMVYSGLDGTGTLLARGSLQSMSSAGYTGAIDSWNLMDLPFAGTAGSVIFQQTGYSVAFDAIMLAGVAPTNLMSATPEASSVVMWSIVISIGLAYMGRKRFSSAAARLAN